MNNDKDTGKILEAPDDREGTNYIFLAQEEHGDKYGWNKGPPVPLPFRWREAMERVERIIGWLDTPQGTWHSWRCDPDLDRVIVATKHAVLDPICHSRTGPERYLIWGHPETIALGAYFMDDYREEYRLSDRSIMMPWWWLKWDPERDTDLEDERIKQANEYLSTFVEKTRDEFGCDETEEYKPPWEEGPEAVFTYIYNHSAPPDHTIKDVQKIESWGHVARKLREAEPEGGWKRDRKLTKGNLRTLYFNHKDELREENPQQEMTPEEIEERAEMVKKGEL